MRWCDTVIEKNEVIIMEPISKIILSTSPPTQPARKPRRFVSLAHRQRYLYRRPRRNNTGKELDIETGLYYYGARYLDPKISRWLSGDPALGEYVPQAGRQSGGLPGMGGVYNTTNLHVYHYGGNNPVKYIDPNGRFTSDSDGNLIAETGDSAGTLANLLGITVTSALSLLSDQGYTRGYLEGGNKITLDNVYTRSIANANISDDYLNINCYSATIAGTSGQEISTNSEIKIEIIDLVEDFNKRLESSYTPLKDGLGAGFGTVLRFRGPQDAITYRPPIPNNPSDDVKHGAVLYCIGNDGTKYVYTKNGYDKKPVVMKLTDLISEVYKNSYVDGYYNFGK
jgi:RHS repeat-associated protein